MSVTLLESTTPTAAKAHKCIWCGEQIAKGERYDRNKMIYDGDFHDNKFHLECGRASQQLDAGDEFTPYSNPRGSLE